MFQLENSEYLYALLLIPAFVMLFIFYWQRRRRALSKYGELPIISELFSNASIHKPWIKFTLMMLAMLMLITGIINPQYGTKEIEVKREGVDVIVALDISNSMMAEDLKPNRLARAKQSISNLIGKLRGDRIGIIVFAGEAFVQLPLTTDYSAAKLFLSSIDTDMMPVQGTAIGAAIDLAVESFDNVSSDDEQTTDTRQKALILITDGENHEDNAMEAAARATEKGFVIYTIGMGKLTGSPIPIYNGVVRTGDFMKDKEGNVVISKLDESTLQKIASVADGKFILATDSGLDLSALLDEIAQMEKQELETKLFTDYEDLYYYFFFIAFLLLIIEAILSERKNKFLASMNLFGSNR